MSASATVRPNVIQEVKIGTQTWALYNYDFGGLAPNHNKDNITNYGTLFTWDEAVAIAAGIDGWHLPSVTEISTLAGYLGGWTGAGGKLKSTGTTYWQTPNTGATNEVGFSARGAGENGGDFMLEFHFWLSDEVDAFSARYASMFYNNSNFGGGTPSSKDQRRSVRLIKD